MNVAAVGLMTETNASAPCPAALSPKTPRKSSHPATSYVTRLLNVTFNVDFFPGASVNLFTFTFPDSTHTMV